jgi:hypothetical protein
MKTMMAAAALALALGNTVHAKHPSSLVGIWHDNSATPFLVTIY